MTRLVRGTLAAVLSLLIILSGSGLRALEAQAPMTDGDVPRTVTTSGLGVAEAEPDEATIRLGVEVQADTAIDAFEQANEQAQDLIDALMDADVAEEDIQTRVVQLQPIYEQMQPPTPLPDQPGAAQQQQQEVIGYRATNVVRVTVGTIEDIGPVLDAAVEAGGNVIQGVTFGFSDATDLLSSARDNAFEDAREKAMQLADLANATLGEVLTINDFSRAPIRTADVGIGGAGGLEAAVIQPGTETITVDLQVTWRLQDGDGMAPTPDTTPSPDETVTPDADTTPEAGLVEGPSVTVDDQTVDTDNTVTIAEVLADEPGWLVIHADDDGSPGPVLGWAAVDEGMNEDVVVELTEGEATDTLHAMLHIDAGVMGTYEFPGADIPARDADGAVVVVPFDVTE